MSIDARGALWEVTLNTFAGVVPGATHWIATLAGRVEDVEVHYVLDPAGAAALSTPDFRYHVGDYSNRFRDRRSAMAAGVAAFRFLAGPRDALAEKYEDGVVLAGPEDLVAAGTGLDEDAWWEWKVATFVPHEHDRVFGYGAPPSVRRPGQVIVRRDGDTYTVVQARLGDDTLLDEYKEPSQI